MAVDDGLQKLRDLNIRMIRLHKVLLDQQHRAYERDYGPVMPAQLLQLLLTSEQFAWLRPLSGLMACWLSPVALGSWDGSVRVWQLMSW